MQETFIKFNDQIIASGTVAWICIMLFLAALVGFGYFLGRTR